MELNVPFLVPSIGREMLRSLDLTFIFGRIPYNVKPLGCRERSFVHIFNDVRVR